MLLEVLRPLEGLSAKFASMRLQRYVDANVRGNVIAFHDSDTAASPPTGEVEIVGTLATNMGFTDVFLS